MVQAAAVHLLKEVVLIRGEVALIQKEVAPIQEEVALIQEAVALPAAKAHVQFPPILITILAKVPHILIHHTTPTSRVNGRIGITLALDAQMARLQEGVGQMAATFTPTTG